MVAAGSITVAVRVRPPSQWEAARLPEPVYDTCIRGEGQFSTPGKSVTSSSFLRDIVQVVDDRILTFDPPENNPSKAFLERGFLPPGTKRYKDKRFMFDRVFNNEAGQIDVYEATAKPLLQPLLNGYNATVFAYGATGCGKTHTISGTESDPGVIYLTMAELFQRIEDRRDEWEVDVTVTFLEIYNEEIRDLLADATNGGAPPRGGLQIREDKTVKVVGLVEARPRSAEEVKAIVLQGNTRRTQSPTHANETSSRSHAVLQVHVTQAPRTANLTEQKTVATLSIIDLAGSERAAATSNMGQRMVEGANINKSLLALGNCINALCESGGATRHVPYRNSKLTRLLKFSLGGNCKTVMIVCVAPTSSHFDDTHNTLLYAERATKIKTKVVTRNVVNVDRHVGRYVEAINKLNVEVAELKAKLAGKLGAEAEVARRKKAEAKAEVERAKGDMENKAAQTKSSIADGATCSGKISVAQVKLRAIRARLAQLDAQASSGPLSTDLEAERGLLRSIAKPEEQAASPQSALNIRVQRSSNSGNMFEALLRAVSERKSDKLDEVSVENVKLDARYLRAEMERAKAEAQVEALKEAVQMQAETIVNFVGMMGRCTVMLGDASQLLKRAVDEDGNGSEGTVKTVAASLKRLADGNNEAFEGILGHSTAAYTVSTDSPSSLSSFARYTTTFTPRITSGPVAPQEAKVKVSRRASSYGSTVTSPGRKAPRQSPRKSLRSSLAPYRRVSEQGRGREKKKGVQWKDEAGEGDLDDGGARFSPPISGTSSEPESISASLSGRSVVSESEWEDEKTDDSLSFSLPSSKTSTGARLSVSGAKRPRASRLDPNFFRSKVSTLSSLAEDEEYEAESRPPLADRDVNTPDSAGKGPDLSSLHVPKNRERGLSPTKRVPGTPRHSAIGKGGRRRSSLGPMLRNDKARRRTSMIPQLSPKHRDPDSSANNPGTGLDPDGSSRNGSAIRPAPVNESISAVRTPAKRPKRLSTLPSGTSRLKANLSTGSEFRGPRPSWK